MSADDIPFGDTAEPVFAEPWQAHAFALVVALHDRGLFGWSEWTRALGARTRQTGRAADYAAWIATLEGLLAARGILGPELLAERRAAFARAAAATPHGDPILLANDPLAQDPLAQDPLAQDPLAQDPLAQDLLAQDPLARDPLANAPTASRAPASIPG